MAESMWDAALKGAAFGQMVGDRFTRFNANRKASNLEEDIEANPEKYKTEIDRRRAYAQGIADITQAARGRGIDLEGELMERYDENRGREGDWQYGEAMMGGGEQPAPIAPGAPFAPTGADAEAATAAGAVPGIAAGAAPLGAAPIAPPASPLPKPNYAQAARTGADFAYAGRDREAGNQYTQQGVNIGIGQQAMDVDPISGQRRFNTATAAGGMTEDAAAQGNLAGAQQGQNAKTTALQKYAQQFFGMGMQALAEKNPDKDRVEATFNEGFKNAPQFGIDRTIYNPEKKTLTFMRGPQAVHEQSVATREEMEAAENMFMQYSTDPGEFMDSHYKARLADVAADKEEARGARKEILGAKLRTIEAYKSDPRGVLESSLATIGKNAGGGEKGGGGFDIEKLDLEDGSGTFKVGGQVITITKATEDTKLPPGTKYTPNMLIAQDEKGNVTTIEQAFERNGAKAELAIKMQELLLNVHRANLLQRGADFNTSFDQLNQLDRAYGSNIPETKGARGAAPSIGKGGVTPPADAKVVQQDYQDLGKKHGFEISSMERPVLKGVGAGERSQHPQGTAVDYSVKGKTKEEGDALIADLESKGYQVVDERDGKTGTGPHIHAELPPGGLAGSEPSAPSAPSAPSPAQTAQQPSPADVQPKTEPKLPGEQKPPMQRTTQERLADPATHRANAARATKADKTFTEARGALERFNNAMQDKYGPQRAAFMTDAERGAYETLSADFASAQQEYNDASRLATGEAAASRRQRAAKTAATEQEDLVAQYRNPKAGGKKGEGPKPDDYVGSEPSKNFFMKYMTGFK